MSINRGSMKRKASNDYFNDQQRYGFTSEIMLSNRAMSYQYHGAREISAPVAPMKYSYSNNIDRE